jgi:hypothetical protein
MVKKNEIFVQIVAKGKVAPGFEKPIPPPDPVPDRPAAP